MTPPPNDVVEIAVGVFMDTLDLDADSARAALERQATAWEVSIEVAATEVLLGARRITDALDAEGTQGAPRET